MAQVVAAVPSMQRESIAGLWAELMPLMRAHGREVDAAPVSPDHTGLETLDRAGLLRLFTLRRADWRLIGYGCFIVGRDGHAQRMIAKQTALYVDRAHRGRADQFIYHCEIALRAEGVAEVFQEVTPARDFSPLLLRRGYRLASTTYAKRLEV